MENTGSSNQRKVSQDAWPKLGVLWEAVYSQVDKKSEGAVDMIDALMERLGLGSSADKRTD